MHTIASRKKAPIRREPIAEQQADVALLDMRDLMSITRMGRSYLYAAVREGTFPAPVLRKPRCTRWRLSDVREHLQNLSAPASNNG